MATPKDDTVVEAGPHHDGSDEFQPPRRRTWHHTTLFNAFVIGAVGFLAPGLWNAMSSLGAGGAQEPYLVNAANALVFGLMGILCLFGGPIANRIGLSWTLCLGAVGYPIYSAGLYVNNRYGNEWLVLVGAVTCGLSAGLFWASEGAVALGYPEPGKRGRYMNIWLWFRTGGPLVGGAIVLALNNDASAKAKGKIDPQVYLIFIALQCVAAPVALLLSPPEKVQRADGSKVIVKAEKSFKAEFRALYQASTRKDVLILLPIFWAAYFNQYNSNFQTYYFGVRARALIGFVMNFGVLLSSQIMSSLLDYKGFPIKKRIEYGFWYVVFWHIVAWVYAWVIQEKYTRTDPAWDWEDKGFVEGFFVLCLWDFSRQALQNWLYYFLATKTDNISELSRFSGILRGQESFAQAISFGINTRKWHGGRVPMGINTVLLALAAYPTWLAMRQHVPVEKHTDGEDEEIIPAVPGNLTGNALFLNEWPACILRTPMDFNLSVSQVAHWLDALPFDQTAPTPEADCQRALKRRRSFRPNESNKRRHPISPPPSQPAHERSSSTSTASPDVTRTMAPSTPSKSSAKRPATDAPMVDTDQTPRASKASGSRGPLSNAPSLSSSQSDAYSRDSKRSKRSQSPSKLFPLYGPEGHRLIRDSLSMTAPTHNISPTLRDFLGDINDVAGRHCIMPRRIKAALQEHLDTTGQFERLHEYMFFDDETSTGSGPCGASGEELVRRALRIATRSSDCSRMLSDESAWNNLVHSPLLDMLVYDMKDSPNQDVLDFVSCTTTNIDSSYHRFPDAASRVDYVLQLLPEHDPTMRRSHEALLADTAPCFNWTADRLLQQYPLAVSIETKRYGGNTAKGEQQLGIWHAAHWEFLASWVGVEPLSDLGFLPGVVVQGHTWSLVITTRRQATTTVLCSVEFGNTGSLVGVFQVLAGLRRLRSWSLEVLWPWYKQHLPGLSSPSNNEEQTSAAAGGEAI
ncbi:duf895 domain membrane protein [Fusarium albosuccineum]|uniref:Duf895 domain membrane protein n=1 Tax=Fusarium albosuccineum TaxID=1237068 RepID=A0A8H4P4S9_9HYPO|nr:duf895 domain membrane protein [Fusarium albosuccineum]